MAIKKFIIKLYEVIADFVLLITWAVKRSGGKNKVIGKKIIRKVWKLPF